MNKFLKFGIILALLMIIMERVVIKTWDFKKTEPLDTVTQPKLDGTMTHLLNDDGEMTHDGWYVNHPPIINNQMEKTRSHLGSNWASQVMARNLNFMQIQAAGKNIILVLPINFGSFCAVRVQMFDMTDDGSGLDTERVQEYFFCPTYSEKDTNMFQSDGVELSNSNYMRFNLKPMDEDRKKWSFKLEADSIRVGFNFEFDMHDSLTWAQPLSDDKKLYTLTHKTLGVPLKGSVTIDGVTTDCNNDCVLSQDSFKAHHGYPTNMYFGLLQQILPDGRAIGITMGDGYGSDVSLKQSNDDFVSLDGKIHKLDLTELTEEKPGDPMSVRHFKTVDRVTDLTTKCDLIYRPSYPKVVQYYFIVFVIKQAATFGRYTGQCVINDEVVKVDAWGFLEFAHLRW